MPDSGRLAVARLLQEHEDEVIEPWLQALRQQSAGDAGRISFSEIATQARAFLGLLVEALRSGADARHEGYEPVRAMLADISRSRAVHGFTPRETAMFVLALKRPLQGVLRRRGVDDDSMAMVADVLDELGLHTLDVFQTSREEVILRQQQEISELSTPVIKLWHGILALPLIGTLDSQRTQVVMENLLDAIVQQSAEIAIIDITGVPTVDTLTAQHLLKTIAAARLMGADCIISGIRPQIAQTMVHLGVELSVVSKATLADAFALALSRQGRVVARRPRPEGTAGAKVAD